MVPRLFLAVDWSSAPIAAQDERRPVVGTCVRSSRCVGIFWHKHNAAFLIAPKHPELRFAESFQFSIFLFQRLS